MGRIVTVQQQKEEERRTREDLALGVVPKRFLEGFAISDWELHLKYQVSQPNKDQSEAAACLFRRLLALSGIVFQTRTSEKMEPA